MSGACIQADTTSVHTCTSTCTCALSVENGPMLGENGQSLLGDNGQLGPLATVP